MRIGLTGRICAGKDVTSNYLKLKGFEKYLTRDEVTEEVLARGLEPTRSNLILVGRDVWANQGVDAWIKRIYEKSQSIGQEKIVIDALRHPGEVDFLKSKSGYLISLDAPQELRYERWKSRKRPGDPQSFEEFQKIDSLDYDEGKELGYRVKDCMEMADFSIYNDSSVLDLYRNINDVLEQIRSG